MPRLRDRLISPAVLWTIVALGTVGIFKWTPERRLFPGNAIATLTFILCAINWLYFFAGALRVNRNAPRSAVSTKRIVTRGVYRRVRHPIYSADIFLGWGVFLLSPTLSFLVLATWLTIALISWMKLEESALIRLFGEDYLIYKYETPMVIPRFSRRRTPD